MEDSGVNLAEMNKLLLQKIEELTLYAIDKEKEVQKLKEKSERQEEKVSELKKGLKSELTGRKILEERLAKLEQFMANLNQ